MNESKDFGFRIPDLAGMCHPPGIMFLCIGTTPAVQRVMIFQRFKLDAVNRAISTLEGAAGKSVNVAKVLKSLGARPTASGFLGGDRGEFLKGVLTAKGVESDFVTTNARTRECITIIDETSGKITELVEESRAVTPTDYDQLSARIVRHLRECRAAIMSGTLAPGGPVDFYRRCTEAALAVGSLAVVDAQGPALVEALQARPGLVKPNRAELSATVGRKIEDDAEALSAMRELHERGAQRLVVTDGKNPALAFDGKVSWRIRTPSIRVVNPIGSGDALTAALVWRLVEGDDLGEAARWGAAAGAANALSAMPGDVDAADVRRLVREVTAEAI